MGGRVSQKAFVNKEGRKWEAVTGGWGALFRQLPHMEPLERGGGHNHAILRRLTWRRNKWTMEIIKMEINGL